MQRKQEEEEDPYELIRRLRAVISTQKEKIEEDELIFNSLFHEKNAAVRETAELRQQVAGLKRQLQNERSKRSTTTQVTEVPVTASLSRGLSLATLASPNRKQDVFASQLSILATPNSSTLKKKAQKQRQFVPGDVHFSKKRVTHRLLTNDSFVESPDSIGEFLVEDVMVVAPDITELKRQREDQRFAEQLCVQEYSFFNHNPLYKAKKEEYLLEVAQRCFPMGATATRRTVENLEEFKLEMEARGSPGAEGLFVVNLKGDFNVPPLTERVMLGGCNPFRGLFAVCLKVPDFVPMREESRHMRNETVVWMIEKVYVVLTYFPFLQLHLALLQNIASSLQPKWHLLHRQELFSRNLTRNLAEAQKHDSFSKIVAYLRSKRPEHGDVCQWEKEYFGSIPPAGQMCSHSTSLFAAPLFFSVFAYEETLLLLTALFLEKNIVFMSEREGAATLCALFLVTCIAPLVYNQVLILNFTHKMMENFVFGYPFPLVASTVKSSATQTQILGSFIDNNSQHFKGFGVKEETAPLILVDIDSNTIIYDQQLNKTFQAMIVSPSKELRDSYLAYNPAHSKSFSFPRKMPVEYQSVRPRNDHEKNADGRKKLLKEYEHKIENNTSKWPSYSDSPQAQHLHHLLTQYIASLGVEEEKVEEMLAVGKEGRKRWVRQHLMAKHSDKTKLVEVLLESQIYADYLDKLEREAGGL